MKIWAWMGFLGLLLAGNASLRAEVKRVHLPVMAAVDHSIPGKDDRFGVYFVKTAASLQIPFVPMGLSVDQFLEGVSSTSSGEDRALGQYFAALEKGDAKAVAEAYSASGGFNVTNAEAFLAMIKPFYTGEPVKILGRIPLKSAQSYVLVKALPGRPRYLLLTLVPEAGSWKLLAMQNSALLGLVEWCISHSREENPLASGHEGGADGEVLSEDSLADFAQRKVTDPRRLEEIRAVMERAEKTELREGFTMGSQRRIESDFGGLPPEKRAEAARQFASKWRNIDAVLDFDPVYAVATNEPSSERFVLLYRDGQRGMLIANVGVQDAFSCFLGALSPLIPRTDASR